MCGHSDGMEHAHATAGAGSACMCVHTAPQNVQDSLTPAKLDSPDLKVVDVGGGTVGVRGVPAFLPHVRRVRSRAGGRSVGDEGGAFKLQACVVYATVHSGHGQAQGRGRCVGSRARRPSRLTLFGPAGLGSVQARPTPRKVAGPHLHALTHSCASFNAIHTPTPPPPGLLHPGHCKGGQATERNAARPVSPTPVHGWSSA